MTTLRFGILGTGNIAQQFCAGVARSDRIALTAVGSRTRESSHNFAKRFQISNAYDSYESLLADPTVDAIYNSLPNSLHHEWTIKALRAGKHVLCEKPLATNLAQAQEMFVTARESGKLLVEAFMYVSHPQTSQIIERVKSGAIGELRLIRTSFCYRTTKIDGNIRFSSELAGGALMDVGCYCTHFSRMIAGAEPIAIHAVGKLHASGVDESTSAVLKFPNDVLATFSCGMSVQADNSAHICGTEGYIEIPWPWKPTRSASFTIGHSIPPKQDKGATAESPRQTIHVEAPGELYELEANDFAAAILDGTAPRLSESDSIGNQRVLDEIRRQIGVRFAP